MGRIRSMGEWLRSLFTRGRLDRELKEEFEFHLEQEVLENVRKGMMPKEARRQALLAFGGTDWYGERSRDERPGRLLDDLVRDLRLGVRNLRKRPVFAIAAILTLSLGVGMSTTMFTLVDAIVLHPLTGSNSEGLVYLERESDDGRVSSSPTGQLIGLLREHASSFARIESYSREEYDITVAGRPYRMAGAAASDGFFDFLGVRPELGRGFLPGDGGGGTPVVILSYLLWRERFGEDPLVLGQTMEIDDRVHEVVGVLPRGFRVDSPGEISFWIPEGPATEVPVEVAIARLAQGISLEAARDELDAVIRNNPLDRDANFQWIGRIHTPRDLIDPSLTQAILILQAGALLVLLIGCGNLANLLLAQGESRAREVAVRASLGAGRGRLLRQLLAENLGLGALGGLGGVLVTVWALDTLPFFLPPGYSGFSFDRSALLVALGLSVGAVLLSGIMPALKGSKRDLAAVIKDGSTMPRGFFKRGGVRQVLVTTEVAMAFVLLVSAGLLLKSFAGLSGIDTGFDSEGLLTLRLELPDEEYTESEMQVAFFDRLLDGIGRGFPSQLGPATLASGLVENLAATISPLVPEGSNADEAEDVVFLTRSVAPDFFRIVGIPILQGRPFEGSDGRGEEQVVIINETVARRFFPGVDPVGRRIQLRDDWLRVVGVSGAIHLPGLAQSSFGDLQLFYPYQQDVGAGITVLARVEGDGSNAVEALRRVVGNVDPSLPILDIALADDLLAESLNQERSNALLMALFALTALVLGSIGIYGVVAYSVSRQIREIGIRLALGSSKGAVVSRVVQGGMRTVGLGMILGTGGALALGGIFSDLLHEVDPRDPWVFFTVFSGIAAVALLSTWLPARRAAGPSPIQALKTE